jgi:hypothetical protein
MTPILRVGNYVRSSRQTYSQRFSLTCPQRYIAEKMSLKTVRIVPSSNMWNSLRGASAYHMTSGNLSHAQATNAKWEAVELSDCL